MRNYLTATAYRQAMLEQGRVIEAARRGIDRGERPVFYVVTSWDGSAIDVRILELPLVHVFVPDESRVLDGARELIARTLSVDAASFAVQSAPERT